MQDAKIVDSACLALTRIAEAFSRSPAHLETLCGLGLVSSIVQMVGVSESGSMTSQLQVRPGLAEDCRLLGSTPLEGHSRSGFARA